MSDVIIESIEGAELIESAADWKAWIQERKRVLGCRRLRTDAPKEFPVRVTEDVEHPTNIMEPSRDVYTIYRPTEKTLDGDQIWEVSQVFVSL